MKYLKRLGITYGWIFIIFFSLTLIITILSYFNLFNDSIISFLKIMIPIISLFIGGLIIGRHSLKKGWLEGLKIGLLFSIISFFISLLFFKYNFHFSNLLFYIIITTSSILGSMIGINYKGI